MGSGLLLGVDGNHLPPCPRLERDDAVGSREERVIAPTTDISARMEFGAPLPDDDAASLDLFSTEALDAETLCVAVSTVSTGAYTFFMCHRCPPVYRPAQRRRGSDEDFLDLDFSESLTVTLLTAHLLPPLPPEHDNLLVPAVTKNLGFDLGSFHGGYPHLNRAPIGSEENVVEGDGITGLDVQAGNPELLTGFRPKLFSARPEYRVHKALRSDYSRLV